MGMPTHRHRYMITETDEVAVALTEAAARWPELQSRPGALLHRLISEGHRALRRSAADRAAAVADTAGAGTGAYPSGYLVELRQDWPE